MRIGKEVSYLNTKVGDLTFSLDFGSDLIIIEDEDGKTKIYNRQEYETFLTRHEKISKLLQNN